MPLLVLQVVMEQLTMQECYTRYSSLHQFLGDYLDAKQEKNKRTVGAYLAPTVVQVDR